MKTLYTRSEMIAKMLELYSASLSRPDKRVARWYAEEIKNLLDNKFTLRHVAGDIFEPALS